MFPAASEAPEGTAAKHSRLGVAMTREPFPWRLWLLTHGTALAALATGRLIVGGWLLALPFAAVIAIPFDVMILVEWLGGGIRGGEFLPGRPPAPRSL